MLMNSTRTRLAIAELTSTLSTDFDLAALLDAVATDARVCFQAYAAAVVLRHRRDGADATALHVVAQALRENFGTDGAVSDLSFQATGPALDSARDGAVTMIADLTDVSDTAQGVDTRWSGYRRAAAAAGMRGMRAFPITSLGIPLGAVVVHTDEPWGSQRPSEFGQVLANLVGIALSIGPPEQRRASAADTIVETVLRDGTVIATATGIIAEVFGLDFDHARLRLRQLAREHGVTLTAHARAIVDTHDAGPHASATAAVFQKPPDLAPPRRIDN
jgi:ANTAR domain-containing protein/GAF domain-containing protein